jgi:hypothetical protein
VLDPLFAVAVTKGDHGRSSGTTTANHNRRLAQISRFSPSPEPREAADGRAEDEAGGADQPRGGSFTTLTKNSSIWRTTAMKLSKSTGFVT